MFLERLSKISRRRSRRIRENFFLTIFLSSTFAKSAAYSPSLPMAMTTISAQSAAALDAELMSGDAPPFKLEQLMELAGLAVAPSLASLLKACFIDVLLWGLLGTGLIDSKWFQVQ